MLSYEEIMNYCSNYKIDNGIVIDKNTNQQVIDEEIVLIYAMFLNRRKIWKYIVSMTRIIFYI